MNRMSSVAAFSCFSQRSDYGIKRTTSTRAGTFRPEPEDTLYGGPPQGDATDVLFEVADKLSRVAEALDFSATFGKEDSPIHIPFRSCLAEERARKDRQASVRESRPEILTARIDPREHDFLGQTVCLPHEADFHRTPSLSPMSRSPTPRGALSHSDSNASSGSSSDSSQRYWRNASISSSGSSCDPAVEPIYKPAITPTRPGGLHPLVPKLDLAQVTSIAKPRPEIAAQSVPRCRTCGGDENLRSPVSERLLMSAPTNRNKRYVEAVDILNDLTDDLTQKSEILISHVTDLFNGKLVQTTHRANALESQLAKSRTHIEELEREVASLEQYKTEAVELKLGELVRQKDSRPYTPRSGRQTPSHTFPQHSHRQLYTVWSEDDVIDSPPIFQKVLVGGINFSPLPCKEAGTLTDFPKFDVSTTTEAALRLVEAGTTTNISEIIHCGAGTDVITLIETGTTSESIEIADSNLPTFSDDERGTPAMWSSTGDDSFVASVDVGVATDPPKIAIVCAEPGLDMPPGLTRSVGTVMEHQVLVEKGIDVKMMKPNQWLTRTQQVESKPMKRKHTLLALEKAQISPTKRHELVSEIQPPIHVLAIPRVPRTQRPLTVRDRLNLGFLGRWTTVPLRCGPDMYSPVSTARVPRPHGGLNTAASLLHNTADAFESQRSKQTQNCISSIFESCWTALQNR